MRIFIGDNGDQPANVGEFTRWLMKDRRAGDDPLAFIAMRNVSTDRRHDRRPLSESEFEDLIRTANSGPVVLQMAGEDRAMLYAMAAYTGLRASELASLSPESFKLDDDPPTVTIAAALASLPPISDPKAPVSEAGSWRATGTDGPEKVPTMVPSGAENGAIRLASDACDSAPNRTESDQEDLRTRRIGNAKNSVKNGVSRTKPHRLASNGEAERGGFEPPVVVTPRRFSRPVHSAALPPLRGFWCLAYYLIGRFLGNPKRSAMPNTPLASRCEPLARLGVRTWRLLCDLYFPFPCIFQQACVAKNFPIVEGLNLGFPL